MIEKLDINRFSSQIELKINELVDAVNELHEEAESNARTRAYHEKLIDTLVAENNIHEKQIDELQMKVNKLTSNINFAQLEVKENVQDKFAEQRKWIGHLVEYGNADDGFKYGILTNIEPIYKAFPFEIDNGRDATADCWLPDESVFYKKD